MCSVIVVVVVVLLVVVVCSSLTTVAGAKLQTVHRITRVPFEWMEHCSAGAITLMYVVMSALPFVNVTGWG